MDTDTVLYMFVAAAITGLIGIQIARAKGREGLEGFLWGFFLSVIGWFVVLLLPEVKPTPARRASKADARILALGNPTTKVPPKMSVDGQVLRKCPFCAEMILAEAVICRFCQRDVTPPLAVQKPNPQPQIVIEDNPVEYFAHPEGTIYHSKGCVRFPAKAVRYCSLAELPKGLQPCVYCALPTANPPTS